MIIAGTLPRALRSTAGVLSWQPQGPDGEPADPGAVLVSVTSSNGSAVVTSAATVGSGSSPRTYTLTAAQTGALDLLTAVWTVGGVTMATTGLEVCGGVYFTSADLRTGEPSTSDPGRDPTASILAARTAVETLFESTCGVAFVPRFAVERIQIPLTVWPTPARFMTIWPQLRAVRWIRFWTYTPDVYTDLTSTNISQINVGPEGLIDLSTVPTGATWLTIGYEHGYDSPPADLKRAALTWARNQLNFQRNALPDRATMMHLPDGGSVTLATPGVGRWHTGIPAVDEVLRRYDHHAPMAIA